MVTARVGQSCVLAVANGASINVTAAAAFLSMLSSRELATLCASLANACVCEIVFPNSADFNRR
jgi:hypothetical protein